MKDGLNQKEFTTGCAKAFRGVRKQGDTVKGSITVAFGFEKMSISLDGKITLQEIQMALNAIAKKALSLVPKELIEQVTQKKEVEDEKLSERDSGETG